MPGHRWLYGTRSRRTSYSSRLKSTSQSSHSQDPPLASRIAARRQSGLCPDRSGGPALPQLQESPMCVLSARSAAACKRTCAVARVGGAATGADARVAAGWDESEKRPARRRCPTSAYVPAVRSAPTGPAAAASAITNEGRYRGTAITTLETSAPGTSGSRERRPCAVAARAEESLADRRRCMTRSAQNCRSCGVVRGPFVSIRRVVEVRLDGGLGRPSRRAISAVERPSSSR